MMTMNQNKKNKKDNKTIPHKNHTNKNDNAHSNNNINRQSENQTKPNANTILKQIIQTKSKTRTNQKRTKNPNINNCKNKANQ